MHAQMGLLSLVSQGSLVPSASKWGIWSSTGLIRYTCALRKILTYPPPTKDVCCGLDTTLEVLLELVPRAPSSVDLLLKCLNRDAKIGSAIVKLRFRHGRASYVIKLVSARNTILEPDLTYLG
jgi:hypothetical protein